MRDVLAEKEQRAFNEGWGWDGSMKTESEIIDLIHTLVLVTKPEVVVETGTFTGHTTKSISEALERNGRGHLWTVEADEDYYEKYPKDLARTTFVLGDSCAWSADPDLLDPIDLAFVDCGPPEVRTQVVRNLYSRIRDGGLLLVHDTHFHPGFLAALRDILGAPQLDIPALNGLGVWQL